jgi:hypothetical protein
MWVATDCHTRRTTARDLPVGRFPGGAADAWFALEAIPQMRFEVQSLHVMRNVVEPPLSHLSRIAAFV